MADSIRRWKKGPLTIWGKMCWRGYESGQRILELLRSRGHASLSYLHSSQNRTNDKGREKIWLSVKSLHGHKLADIKHSAPQMDYRNPHSLQALHNWPLQIADHKLFLCTDTAIYDLIIVGIRPIKERMLVENRNITIKEILKKKCMWRFD